MCAKDEKREEKKSECVSLYYKYNIFLTGFWSEWIIFIYFFFAFAYYLRLHRMSLGCVIYGKNRFAKKKKRERKKREEGFSCMCAS